MNLSPAHLHLTLNHVPILGTMVFAPLVLGWGLLRHSRDIVHTGLLLTIVLAVTTVPIYLTGEPAEAEIENQPWFSKTLAESHEERAEGALVAVLITGAGASVALWRGRKGKPFGSLLPAAVLAGLAISAGFFAAAALVGGQIRHDELRATRRLLQRPRVTGVIRGAPGSTRLRAAEPSPLATTFMLPSRATARLLGAPCAGRAPAHLRGSGVNGGSR